MPKPLNGNGRYMAGLDGLRAFAVLAVIAYHLNLDWAPGGLLGVGVFFVLSGYLITNILTAQWHRKERIDLKDFWIRRARRLLPAMFIMLAAVGIWILLFDRTQLVTFQQNLLAAVLYVSNWWLIFHKVSYFESFGPPSPLGHLWSLAVEEQFYLLWPLLLILGLRYMPQRGKLAGLTLVGVTVSAVAMALLFQPGVDPSRVYYGTDTRVFGLLIGAALAIVWPSWKLSENISPAARLTIDLAGGIGLLVVLLMIWKTNQYDAFLYRGGLVILSVATAIVVAALAHPASRLGKAMGCKPLRWLGARSYGIYLWHYPVIVLSSPAWTTDDLNIPLAIFQVAASIGLAALSWRLVEEPIRHGAIEKLWARLRSKGWRRGHVLGGISFATVCAVLAISLLGNLADKWYPTATASSVIMKEERPEPHEQHDTPESKAENLAPQKQESLASSKGKSAASQAHTSSTAKNGKPAEQPKQNLPTANGAQPNKGSSAAIETKKIDSAETTDNPITGSGLGVTAIGDSVMVDIAPYLQEHLPGINVDGQIGRQLSQAQAVIDQLKSKGTLGKRIIIELGTNGAFSKEQLESLLRSLDGVEQIVLVNTRVPRPWEGVVNSTLADVAATFPHTTLVNWHEASKGKDSYFYHDGVHLKPEGSRFYAELVAKAVVPSTVQEESKSTTQSVGKKSF